MISLTELAAEKVKTQLEHRGKGLGIRVAVKTTGCSGLSYVMDFDNNVDINDEIVEVDGGLKVVIDKKSVLYLFGTELNYSDGLNGKGFEWVNPNASRTCGCGESFAL